MGRSHSPIRLWRFAGRGHRGVTWVGPECGPGDRFQPCGVICRAPSSRGGRDGGGAAAWVASGLWGLFNPAGDRQGTRRGRGIRFAFPKAARPPLHGAPATEPGLESGRDRREIDPYGPVGFESPAGCRRHPFRRIAMELGASGATGMWPRKPLTNSPICDGVVSSSWPERMSPTHPWMSRRCAPRS